jgi:hypothetical protein
MSGPCDHETFRDLLNNEIFITCYCFCGHCYDHVLLMSEGNGCTCEECFCRRLPNADCRATTALMVPETAEHLPLLNAIPVENVVKDLPEHPGKTGTCRKCRAATYRKGTRGRFPVLCDSCK